jgi:hypothetical protein
MGLGDALLVLEPAVEAVQGAEAVVGGRGPAALQDVDDVVLDVGRRGIAERRPRSWRSAESCSRASR